MSQRFKVGDTVYPVEPTKSSPESRWVKWVAEMDQYAGRPATVTRIDVRPGEVLYVADCTGGTADDEYYFLPDWLAATPPAPPLDVGDFVFWRSPLHQPHDEPRRGRVLGVGERKLSVWPCSNACEPLFVNRDWLVREDASLTETA